MRMKNYLTTKFYTEHKQKLEDNSYVVIETYKNVPTGLAVIVSDKPTAEQMASDMFFGSYRRDVMYEVLDGDSFKRLAGL